MLEFLLQIFNKVIVCLLRKTIKDQENSSPTLQTP